MLQKFISKIKIIILGLIIAFGVSYVSAYTSPTSFGTNPQAPLDVTTTAQTKGTNTTPVQNSLLDLSSNMALSSSTLSVWGDTAFGGTHIYFSKLKDTTANAERKLCIDKDGKFLAC